MNGDNFVIDDAWAKENVFVFSDADDVISWETENKVDWEVERLDKSNALPNEFGLVLTLIFSPITVDVDNCVFGIDELELETIEGEENNPACDAEAGLLKEKVGWLKE